MLGKARAAAAPLWGPHKNATWAARTEASRRQATEAPGGQVERDKVAEQQLGANAPAPQDGRRHSDTPAAASAALA
jgi:hypothetical protein